MPQLELNAKETDILGVVVNEDFDAMDWFPGDLDPAALGRASAEVEELVASNGRGDLSEASIALAIDVLSFFQDLTQNEMQPDEAAGYTSLLAKLRASQPGDIAGR